VRILLDTHVGHDLTFMTADERILVYSHILSLDARK